MQAVNDKIICEFVDQTKTASGILLPRGAVVDQPKYRVLSTGPGRLNLDGSREPCCVKKGDYIIVAAKGSDFEYAGKKYTILVDHSVGGMIKKADYNPAEGLLDITGEEAEAVTPTPEVPSE